MRLRAAWSFVALTAAALAVVFALTWPHAASAHAILQRSLPAQNEKIKPDALPKLVETYYSEAIERSLTTLTVFDSTGKEVQQRPVIFSDSDPTYAAIALPPTLDPGIYTVAFANVSKVDGHTWTGSFSFIVLNQDGSVPSGTGYQPKLAGTQGFLPEAGDSTLRWFELLASVTLTGALIFYLLIARPATGFLQPKEIEEVDSSALTLAADLVLIAAPVLALSALGQVLLLADRLGGPGKLDDILFNTRSGELWLSRMGLSLAIMLLFLPAAFTKSYRAGGRGHLVAAVGLIGSLGLLMTYSLGSHGAADGGAFWGVSADFVHFVATAAWLGALLQLPLLFWWTRGRLDNSKRLLYLANAFDRYSWLAVISVALLIGTGVFNGFVQLPNRPALWNTTYGRVLLVKLGLILPLLGVAGLNAVFFKPRLVTAIDAVHDDDANAKDRERLDRSLGWLQTWLPRTAALEFLLGAAVLASVAILTQSTTALGELAQAAGKPSGQYEVTGPAADLNIDLLIQPFGLGESTFTVTLAQQSGGSVGKILNVRMRAFYDDPNAPVTAGVSGTDQEMTSTNDPAVWTAQSALLTRPGDWRIQVRVQRAGADDVNSQPLSVLGVGGILAQKNKPKGLFDLPFTFVDWNVVAGGAMIALGIGAFLIWRNRPPAWAGSTALSVAAASIVALFAGTTLLFGIHSHSKIPIPIDDPAAIARGQALFEVNCVTCHGVDGRGTGPAATALPIKPADLTMHVPYHNDTNLYLWITEGLPLDSSVKRMPAFKKLLSDKERADIVVYLRHAFGSGEFTPVLPTPQATPPAG
jgi:copper transport protein